MVTQKCRCGKSSRMVPCWLINYPEEKAAKEFDSYDDYIAAKTYTCVKPCGQYKKCKKHKCMNICCPVKKGGPDPDGVHMCLIVCNKKLGCGVH